MDFFIGFQRFPVYRFGFRVLQAKGNIWGGPIFLGLVFFWLFPGFS